MQRRFSALRNKLMVGSALIAACVLSTPAALAHDRYDHDSRDSDLLGALVVGAVIGGVLVSATQHRHDYGYYYPAQSGGYAPSGYYGAAYYGGPYYRGPYYGRGYYGGGYFPRYGYGSGVNLSYSSRGSHRRDYDYRDWQGYSRSGYGRDNYRGDRGSGHYNPSGSYYSAYGH